MVAACNPYASLILPLLLLLQSSENSPLGNFLKGFIDVPSCHVGECPYLWIWGEYGGIGMSR